MFFLDVHLLSSLDFVAEFLVELIFDFVDSLVTFDVEFYFEVVGSDGFDEVEDFRDGFDVVFNLRVWRF